MSRILKLPTYDVTFGPVAESLAQLLGDKSYSNIGIIVDENTKEHCLPLISAIVPAYTVIEIESGEQNKNIDSCSSIWSQLSTSNFDRHSLIINLGGGVIGDMGGFAASCFMRGIDFIQIPTTLLSQVDASVGGKLGIDFKGLKNFVGLFQNPIAVLVDTTFLTTLPEGELRSGFAEMLKHGLIRDASIWEVLTGSSNWKAVDWEEEIYRSIKIKKAVVELDPKEDGLRKILNFGHTIGHAVESLALHSERPLMHGEAIAIGMMAESILSIKKSSLSQNDVNEILQKILKIYADLDYSILKNGDDILELMKSDKKNVSGTIRFALLDKIGNSVYDIEATSVEIKSALEESLRSIKNN